MGRVQQKYAGNPAVLSGVRDTLKTQTSYNQIGDEIGSTGFYYDELTFYSAVSKPICKAGITGLSNALYYTFKGEHLEIEPLKKVIRAANVACEVPSRYLYTISKEKQIWEKDNPNEPKKTWFNFMLENSKISYLAEATNEGIIKSFTADQLGEQIINRPWFKFTSIKEEKEIDNYLTCSKAIREVTAYIENVAAGCFGGDIGNAGFLSKDDIYTKAWKSFAMFNFNPLAPGAYLTFGTAITVDFTGQFVNNMINAWIYTAFTRPVQDSVGFITRETGNYFFSSNKSYSNNTTHPEISEQIFNHTDNITHAEIPGQISNHSEL